MYVRVFLLVLLLGSHMTILTRCFNDILDEKLKLKSNANYISG